MPAMYLDEGPRWTEIDERARRDEPTANVIILPDGGKEIIPVGGMATRVEK